MTENSSVRETLTKAVQIYDGVADPVDAIGAATEMCHLIRKALTQLADLERDREAMEGAIRDAIELIGTPTRLCLGRYSNDRNVLVTALPTDFVSAFPSLKEELKNQREYDGEISKHTVAPVSGGDSDICSRCREHTSFEQDDMGQWISDCCAVLAMEMGT